MTALRSLVPLEDLWWEHENAETWSFWIIERQCDHECLSPFNWGRTMFRRWWNAERTIHWWPAACAEWSSASANAPHTINLIGLENLKSSKLLFNYQMSMAFAKKVFLIAFGNEVERRAHLPGDFCSSDNFISSSSDLNKSGIETVSIRRFLLQRFRGEMSLSWTSSFTLISVRCHG